MDIDLNLKQIYFKIAARSKYFRENFSELEAAMTNLQGQINELTTAATGSETVQARNYAETLNSRLNFAFSLFPNSVIDGFEVVELPTPAMKVRVKAGRAVVNGVYVQLGYATWTRSGAEITITEKNHGLSLADNIFIDSCSDQTTIPAAEYSIVSVIDSDNFKVTGFDTGDTSGSLEFSRYSETITVPAAGLTQLHKVVINSGNSLSIISESAHATDIYFPPVSDSELSLAGLVTKDSTTEMNDRKEIFDFIGVESKYPDLYLHDEILRDGYRANNIISDGSINVIRSEMFPVGGNLMAIESAFRFLCFKCDGIYYETETVAYNFYSGNGPTNAGSPEDYLRQALNSGYKSGDGLGYFLNLLPGRGALGRPGITFGANEDNGHGGCGGAAIFAKGGDGGTANTTNLQYAITNDGQRGFSKPAFLIKAEKIYLEGDIDLSGFDGGDGVEGSLTTPTYGTQYAYSGGGGGGAGGIFFAYAKDIYISESKQSTLTINVDGGDGGNKHASSADDNGGGGGGGGFIALYYEDNYYNSGFINLSYSGGTGKDGGTDGEDGIGANINVDKLTINFDRYKAGVLFDEIFNKLD